MAMRGGGGIIDINILGHLVDCQTSHCTGICAVADTLKLENKYLELPLAP